MNGEYSVSQSPLTREELWALLEVARATGRKRVAIQSVRWILEELSRTPLEFGESRNDLPHLDLHLRVAYTGPIRVDFAVHVIQRKVFIRKWSLGKP